MAKDFTEKTLEDWIFENAATIHEKGFEVMLNNTKRQYKLPSGKIIDIVTFESNGDELMLYIIELKKNSVNAEALSQVFGYYDELIFYLSKTYNVIYHKLILVGYDIDEMPLLQYTNGNIEIYRYDYNINGLSFELKSSTIPTAEARKINKGSSYMQKVPFTLKDQINFKLN